MNFWNPGSSRWMPSEYCRVCLPDAAEQQERQNQDSFHG
jgi:hypothetical protein